jgi:hypothetical protein
MDKARHLMLSALRQISDRTISPEFIIRDKGSVLSEETCARDRETGCMQLLFLEQN